MQLITVYDCPGANINRVTPPPGVKMAGYITGSGPVPWTDAMFARYPDAIRIDQAPENTPMNETADALDMENGAATLQDIQGWVHGAEVNYRNDVRPGQRTPIIYEARSNVTPVVNTLINAGINAGVGLWIAEESSFDDAAREVINASGPFPVIGRQYQFNDLFDVSVFNAEWFNRVSGKTPVSAPKSGVQGGWKWCHKCQGMFYGPHGDSGRCPVGGTHEGVGSYDYEIGFSN